MPVPYVKILVDPSSAPLLSNAKISFETKNVAKRNIEPETEKRINAAVVQNRRQSPPLVPSHSAEEECCVEDEDIMEEDDDDEIIENTPINTTSSSENRQQPSSSNKNKKTVYRDYAHASDEPVALLSKYSHTGRLRLQNTFPVKLHSIVERSEIEGYSNAISWLPHGRAFSIHNTTAMLEHVIKKFFFISKYSSFQRQLNIYGFRKLLKGPDAGCYCHELFLRGRPGLCPGIMRLKKRPEFDPLCEPNFYKFKFLDEIAAANVELEDEENDSAISLIDRVKTDESINEEKSDKVDHVNDEEKANISNKAVSNNANCPLRQLSEIIESYQQPSTDN